MSFDPTQVRPLGTRVLVKRYIKPEKVKGIYVPEKYRPDATLSLWEVVTSSAGANEHLGDELQPDDIVQTRPFRGVEAGDGEHYFINANEILKVIRWN